jgi:hypothetical protein
MLTSNTTLKDVRTRWLIIVARATCLVTRPRAPRALRAASRRHVVVAELRAVAPRSRSFRAARSAQHLRRCCATRVSARRAAPGHPARRAARPRAGAAAARRSRAPGVRQPRPARRKRPFAHDNLLRLARCFCAPHGNRSCRAASPRRCLHAPRRARPRRCRARRRCVSAQQRRVGGCVVQWLARLDAAAGARRGRRLHPPDAA